MTLPVLAFLLACAALQQAPTVPQTSAAAQQPPAANYDETKVPRYTLPELLVTSAREGVRAPGDWMRRREEIRALLEAQMFGKAPGRPDKIKFDVISVEKGALGGTAVRKDVSITVRGQSLRLLLYLPVRTSRPVPVFLGLGFAPNHTVAADPGIPLAGAWERDAKTGKVQLRPAAESSRGASASRWQVEKILERGYGLATMYYGDIEPDFDGGMSHGVRGKYLRPGQQAPGDGEWGAIAAWAWGLGRAVDYLETDQDVNRSAIAVVGHSRLGKTALWAGATDQRFAMVISNDSGEGGAAISRRRFGETVADVNRRFPHWFCGNYKQYSGREDEMPFDAHMLLALAAPRPLYVASADEDQWADPRGEFLAAVAASQVWEMLDRKGIGTATMPPVNEPVGDLVRYHVRTGKHDITAYDWEQYLDFADRHLRGRR